MCALNGEFLITLTFYIDHNGFRRLIIFALTGAFQSMIFKSYLGLA